MKLSYLSSHPSHELVRSVVSIEFKIGILIKAAVDASYKQVDQWHKELEKAHKKNKKERDLAEKKRIYAQRNAAYERNPHRHSVGSSLRSA